jgi:oligoribonuclease NrnB/cAMP/cGMP phosphodiesterase (DHH superfamily)
MTNGLFTSLLDPAVQPDKDDSNPLVIYHGKCADGFAAALAAWLFFEGRGEYLGLAHGQIQQLSELPALTGRAVYILDFSFSAELLQGIDDVAAKLVMLDHHKSAADKLGAFKCRCGIVHFDMSQSGAKLAWRFFQRDQAIPDLVRYIEDRDIWVWQYPQSAAFLAALDMEPFEFARWGEIASFTPEQSAAFCQRGGAMNEKFMSLCHDIARNALPVTFNGESGLMVNCPGAFSSEVGDLLATQSGTFALLWNHSKDGIVKVSLRAVRPYNVIPLAESMGGGGHAQACGFKMGVDRLPELLTGSFSAAP